MLTRHLRILNVEDSPADAELIQRELRRANVDFTVTRVETEDDFRQALESTDPDVILGDYNLPRFDGVRALEIARDVAPEIPFIFVSGSIGEERAIQTLREGAADYVLKDRMARLPAAIKRVLEERRERQLRRSAQQALLRSEERFRLAARATMEVICDLNPATETLTFNEALSTLWGYECTDDPVPFSWWLERVHPDERDAIAASFNAALVSDERWMGEYRFQRADGSYSYVMDRALIVREPDGRPLRVICAILDISEQVKSEQKIQQLSRQNQLVLNCAGEGIVALDGERRTILVNPAAASMFGCTVEEFRSIDDLHQAFHHSRADGSRLPREECPLSQTITDGRVRSGEDWYFTKDGRAFPVEYSASPIIEDGRVAGCVLIFQDITSRKRLEKQLDQANRVNSLGRVVATIAHEFNNVLMGIQPFAEVIRRNSTDEKLQKAASQIINSVARGKRVTQGVLRFTQPAEPAKQTLDLGQWLQQLAPELRALAGARIDLQIDPGPRGLACSCDPAQLQQVVTNLVINARDAITAGGSITLSVSDSSDPSLYVFGKVPAGTVLLKVSDTGSGMPPHVLNDIFVPLFTTKNTGTGLGLAVAQQVISRHGGTIHVSSTVGEGTTFYVLLPAVELMPPATTDGVVRRSTSVRRVLLVDDDVTVASGIAALLESEGVDVRTVHLGGEALQAVASFAPDAVLLDWSLPDIDGVAVFHQLQKQHPKLPVIFSTGHGDQAELETYLDSPRLAFLRKPYDLDALLEALERVTAASRKEDDVAAR